MNLKLPRALNIILPAVFVIFAGPLYAQTFSGMQLNGSATLEDGGNTLRLTPNVNSLSGSAFFPTQYTMAEGTSFNAFFQFRIDAGSVPGADGLTFVIHSDPDGPFALGLQGVGLGYGDISPSVAFEADHWDNGVIDGGSDNHVGIDIDGSVDSVALGVLAPNLESAQPLYAWVDYDGLGNLEYYVSDSNLKPAEPNATFQIDLTGNLDTCVWLGFTASTGGASSVHDIEDFALDWNSSGRSCGEPAPVPLFSSWTFVLLILLVLLAGLTLLSRGRLN